MKKFIITLLILLILGGVVFFFGWAQFTVPPGLYGVVSSKTHGIDPVLVQSGEFRWIWYKLIPTNTEILKFSLTPKNRSIRSSGSLPSGAIYSSLAGLNADFSWEISGDFSFSIRPDSLPSLILNENIADQEDLNKLEDEYCRRIEALVLKYLTVYGEDENKMGTLLLSASNPELVREIEEAFPGLEKVDCRIQAVRFPDYALYQSVRSLYHDYLAHQQRILEEDITHDAEARIMTRLRMDELEKYGEILSRYPVLLEYLALEKGLLPRLPESK